MKPAEFAKALEALTARVVQLEQRAEADDAAAEHKRGQELRAQVRAQRGRHPLDLDYGGDDVNHWTAEVDRAVSGYHSRLRDVA
jgi:hypothetical protein